MAGAVTTIRIYHDPNVPGATVAAEFSTASGNSQSAMNKLARFFEGAAGGSKPCKVVVACETISTTLPIPAAATATITHANISNTDTLVIGPVSMSWRTSPSGEDQVAIGADATADAALMVAGINAHTVLSGLVVASNVAGVITITAIDPGNGGRWAISTSDATAVALSAAVLTRASGTSAQSLAPITYSRGRA